MTPTQRPTFSWRVIGGGGGFSYLLASGGASGSINFDFTTGSLPAGITFTRASIGTYTNAAGTLITAGNDVARFNYVAGVANLLIEGSATNLLVQSNNFSTTWITSVSTITAAQFTGPDGANSGWKLASMSGGYGGVYLNVTLSTIPYTASIWAKQIVNTDNLLVQLASATTWPLGPGATLARLSAIITPAASGLTNTNFLNGSASPTTVNGIYGAQLETGSVMTSYIPTTTAAVTRAADSATFTIPSGVGHLLYTFDDNSIQSVAVSAGSYTIPTTLNRPNIKSIVGSA